MEDEFVDYANILPQSTNSCSLIKYRNESANSFLVKDMEYNYLIPKKFALESF